MTAPDRRIVLDANILIRLVLGTRVRELVLRTGPDVTLVTPEECYRDARRYLPGLLRARGIDSAPALEVLRRFEGLSVPPHRAPSQA